VPNSAFANFWSQIAGAYASNSRVMFDLMQEPNTMPTDQWLSSINAGIAAIRGVGATNRIMVEGNFWSGAWHWATPYFGARPTPRPCSASSIRSTTMFLA